MFISKKRFFIAFILSVAIVSGCFADYIHDIDVNTISGTLTGPLYTLDYKYNIGFSNLELNVELRLYKRGLDPDSSLAQSWEAGIENFWNGKFDIYDKSSRCRYRINFDVVFCSQLTSSVHSKVDWDIASASRDVAHNVGHLLGLYDEYDGPLVNPENPVYDSTSIMSDIGTTVYKEHYNAFLDWLLLKPDAADRNLYLVTYDPDWVNPPIPEPATVFLLGLGLFLCRGKLSKT
ncbi:MAG: hypothetical protein CVV39_04325 [Planctomycetes bacterium HGW-Planctomycetes-1]|nr:MAG: hypothetical protein CVV39_04325 [Planctomycetes bacterium HGW-Planctomycetes-1]